MLHCTDYVGRGAKHKAHSPHRTESYAHGHHTRQGGKHQQHRVGNLLNNAETLFPRKHPLTHPQSTAERENVFNNIRLSKHLGLVRNRASEFEASPVERVHPHRILRAWSPHMTRRKTPAALRWKLAEQRRNSVSEKTLPYATANDRRTRKCIQQHRVSANTSALSGIVPARSRHRPSKAYTHKQWYCWSMWYKQCWKSAGNNYSRLFQDFADLQKEKTTN